MVEVEFSKCEKVKMKILRKFKEENYCVLNSAGGDRRAGGWAACKMATKKFKLDISLITVRANFVEANEGAHFPVKDGTGDMNKYFGSCVCSCFASIMFPVRLSNISSSLNSQNPNRLGSSLVS